MKLAFRLCLLSLLIGMSMWGCRKEDPRVGKDLLSKDLNDTVVTLTPITHTQREDSVRTHALPTYILGGYNDPVFGKTTASIYHQVLLPTKNVDLGEELSLDSIVLKLAYEGNYGTNSQTQTFTVYEVTERLYSDETYYSNRKFSIDPDPVGSKSNIDFKNLDTTLNIRLDDSFGEKILLQSGTDVMQNNNRFLNYLNGLYITPDTSKWGDGLGYFDLNNIRTELVLYYDNKQANNLTFRFLIDNSGAAINRFEHNYSGTDIAKQLNSSNASGVQKLYAQPMAGVKANLQFPGFKQRFNDVAINQAELTVTAVSPDNDYPPPTQMAVVRIGEDGRNTFIPDQAEGEQYYGGKKESTTINGQKVVQYKFNLARHFQNIISKENYNDYGLYLLSFPTASRANRVVINGDENTTFKPQLRLTYTPINP
jgi:hypothetical protein